ncbi:MAG TPA: limonene-1,2-epoxide hydrolase family protein [Acidimicrobiales bacterium]|nr:limonene-1,2-epoxide hydrolase family protein [Acidimicrobiales bacterium]
MPETSVTTEVEIVRAFLADLEQLDVDAASEWLAEDVVYQNVPLPAARGKQAVERQLRLLERFGNRFEARVHNIASDGPIVLTERTDVLVIGRLEASFWVCGTFEVRNGRIVLWRDYFDYANVVVAFLKGAVRALLGRR